MRNQRWIHFQSSPPSQNPNWSLHERWRLRRLHQFRWILLLQERREENSLNFGSGTGKEGNFSSKSKSSTQTPSKRSQTIFKTKTWVFSAFILVDLDFSMNTFGKNSNYKASNLVDVTFVLVFCSQQPSVRISLYSRFPLFSSDLGLFDDLFSSIKVFLLFWCGSGWFWDSWYIYFFYIFGI